MSLPSRPDEVRVAVLVPWPMDRGVVEPRLLLVRDHVSGLWMLPGGFTGKYDPHRLGKKQRGSIAAAVTLFQNTRGVVYIEAW